MSATVFPTRVDRWYVAIFGFEFLVLTGVFIAVSVADPSTPALLSVGLAAVLCVAAPIWLARTTRYVVSPNELLVTCGPFNWRIPRDAITRLRHMQSLASGPALSRERVEITYGVGRTLMVSPEDENRFLAMLQPRNGTR